jgi:hypothetical protein
VRLQSKESKEINSKWSTWMAYARKTWLVFKPSHFHIVKDSFRKTLFYCERQFLQNTKESGPWPWHHT